MKQIIITIFFLTITLFAQELKIKSNFFSTNQNSGISEFKGDVKITKDADEINASIVTIYSDKDQKPTKFIASGNVSFSIETIDGSVYQGRAQKVVHIPNKKAYYFFKDVYLRQVNENKEIIGEEVVLKTDEGKAYAKGAEKEPVIMIFNIPNKEEKK